ncbi:hypothetical protein C5C11_03785 [Rathayibacter rathayi]|nr:hypothetical protein C5C11_03785 [Rathayibacter rathayi]
MYLRPQRIRAIAVEITDGDLDFYCHQTIDYSSAAEDDELARSGQIVQKSRVCAGALCTLEREDNPTQGMRIAGRLGIYKRDHLDPEAPVYDSVAEWVEAKTQGR